MHKDPEEQIEQLNQQVDDLFQQGEYERAIDVAERAIELTRQHMSEEDPLFAAGLNDLARLYDEVGNYAAAMRLYRQSLQIRRKALGENDPDFATSLSNLGDLYREMGDYGSAEELGQQALEVRRRVLGEKHPQFAVSLNNLATLHHSIGNYVTAEPLYRQALDVFRTSLGEEHPLVCAIMSNLGDLCREVGDYASAEEYFQSSLDIRRAVLGESHPDLATSLNNLAVVYKARGDYTDAEELYQQALEILRKALGENHPDFASSLNNLAELHRSMGDYKAAEPLFRQALDVVQASLGPERLEVAAILNNLATMYHAMGRNAEAERLLRQTLDIEGKVLGRGHREYARSLVNLALLFVATHRPREGFELMEQAAIIDDRIVPQIFRIASERQRLAYVDGLRLSYETMISLILRLRAQTPGSAKAGLDITLRRKGIVAESLGVQREVVLAGRYRENEPKLRELMALRAQIAEQRLAGAGRESRGILQKRLAGWDTDKERLEKELALQIPEDELERKWASADLGTIARALPDGATLVEFVRFDVYDFTADPALGKPEWKPARYVAFVLLAGEPNRVQMIELGEAEKIDGEVTTFRTAIISGRSGARSPFRRFFEAHRDSAGHDLRASVFDPLVPALEGSRRLFLAPDGDLNGLPFEVLPLEDGRCVIDEYRISYLSTGRDLLRFGADSSGRFSDAVVVADPDFDLAGEPAAKKESVVPSGRQSREVARGGLRFNRLRGTRVEGERIGQMLGVRPCMAAEALEGRLKARRSPWVLHIATHGFFLADRKADLERTSVRDGAARGQLVNGLENPMLRSGLALAGANTWLRRGTLPPEAEDGILNGEDASGLDLLDTELVVLSACETGLGEVHVGEGVFGLRRAFVLAGAKTLVMSLWKVPDRETQELMEEFYGRILGGEPRAEALRQAQLSMKAKHSAPRYWGAFICQGEPGPLGVLRGDRASVVQ